MSAISKALYRPRYLAPGKSGLPLASTFKTIGLVTLQFDRVTDSQAFLYMQLEGKNLFWLVCL